MSEYVNKNELAATESAIQKQIATKANAQDVTNAIGKLETELLSETRGRTIEKTFDKTYQWSDKFTPTIKEGTYIKNVGEIEVNLYDAVYGSISTQLLPNKTKKTIHPVGCMRSVRDVGFAKIEIKPSFYSQVGDFDELKTTDKSDIVKAINEVVADSANVSEKINLLKSQTTGVIDQLTVEDKSLNLFNPNDKELAIGKYLTATGYMGNNESYFTSGYMEVAVGKTYYCGANGASWPNNTFLMILFYDENKKAIEDSFQRANIYSVIAPENAHYLRVSCDIKALEKMQVTEEGQYEYEAYREPEVKLNGLKIDNKSITEDKLDETLTSKINSKTSTIIRKNGWSIRRDIGDGEMLSLPRNSIVTDKVIAFSAEIESFNKIIIGHGDGNYDSTYFEITNSSITDSIAGTTQEHGLTLENNIQIKISKKSDGGSDIAIASNGVVKKISIWNSYGNGIVFVRSDGSVLKNCSLSYSIKNITEDTWCFGDSYFSLMNKRWTYYLIQDGYRRILLNGYSGERSNTAYEDLSSLLQISTPRRVVWCMGMNDIDINGTVSETWKSTYDKLVTLSKNKGFELILSTIPCACGGISADDVSGNNGKFRNNNYKNEIVRASGNRYIDFESAVGADKSTGLWFGTSAQDIYDKQENGMLYYDGVHPTEKGAIALYY